MMLRTSVVCIRLEREASHEAIWGMSPHHGERERNENEINTNYHIELFEGDVQATTFAKKMKSVFLKYESHIERNMVFFQAKLTCGASNKFRNITAKRNVRGIEPYYSIKIESQMCIQ